MSTPTVNIVLERAVKRVSYKENWRLVTGPDWVQWKISHPEDGLLNCRKWRVSTWMTESEIIQTIFAAALMAEEHEVREIFKVDGVNAFGPHFSIDEMVKFAKNAQLDLRPPPQPPLKVS